MAKFKAKKPPRAGLLKNDRFREFRQCRRKKVFFTTRAANKRLQALKNQGIESSYYQCPYCGRYHLTHYSEWVDEDS